jgi:hypothetical protein
MIRIETTALLTQSVTLAQCEARILAPRATRCDVRADASVFRMAPDLALMLALMPPMVHA